MIITRVKKLFEYSTITLKISKMVTKRSLDFQFVSLFKLGDQNFGFRRGMVSDKINLLSYTANFKVDKVNTGSINCKFIITKLLSQLIFIISIDKTIIASSPFQVLSAIKHNLRLNLKTAKDGAKVNCKQLNG